MRRVEILKARLVYQIADRKINILFGRSGNLFDEIFEAVGVVSEIFWEVKILSEAGGVELSENY